jgi:hypothetical protein
MKSEAITKDDDHDDKSKYFGQFPGLDPYVSLNILTARRNDFTI